MVRGGRQRGGGYFHLRRSAKENERVVHTKYSILYTCYTLYGHRQRLLLILDHNQPTTPAL